MSKQRPQPSPSRRPGPRPEPVTPAPVTPAPSLDTQPPVPSPVPAPTPSPQPAPAPVVSEPPGTITYSTLASSPLFNSASAPTLFSAEDVDMERFNILLGDAPVLKWVGQPLMDINDLFVKQVILSDEVTEAIATLEIPGFIALTDLERVPDPSRTLVSGHYHVADFLERDGLLICTFQWDKERYGVTYDTRQPMDEELFKEGFIKAEAHHAGTLVPAQRIGENGEEVRAFAAHNEPGSYHDGMYGDEGFVTVAQRLVFPDFVTQEQARGYTDSIICWMGFLNPFVKFPDDYNGGDPTKVVDPKSLRPFLRNGLLAALGDRDAIAFLNDPLNMTYCAEYIYIALNTVLFPFNGKGLMDLLGDPVQVKQILTLQKLHNDRQPTILTRPGDPDFESVLKRNPGNPQFDAFNIQMPVVPPDLPSLAQLLTNHGHPVDERTLPFPCFTISQVLRRAFRVLLPRHKTQHPEEMAAAQSRMFQYVGVALAQQLGLDVGPEAQMQNQAGLQLKMQAIQQFMDIVSQQLSQTFDTYAEFDAVIDQIMAQADALLVGAGDRTRFVPPRIYMDLGQQDGDDNMPQGWGFQLETVGGTISRRVVGDLRQRLPITWREIQLQEPMMRGDDVKLLQGAMIRAGIEVVADGVFGPASAAAVKSYQTDQNLDPTGIIDERTRSLLLAP